MSEMSMQDPGVGSVAQAAGWQSPWLLKQSREAAGLHIAALAAALKVPVRKLEALEAGRYDELPDLTFARALASSACRHLRIDPAPVLEQIPAAQTPQLGDSSLTLNAPFKGEAGVGTAHPSAWLSRPAVLGALALVLGALVIVLLPERAVDTAAAPEATAPVSAVAPEASPSEPVPAAVAPVVEVPAPADTGAAPQAQPGEAAPMVAATAPAATSQTLAAAVAGTAPANESGALLRIKATQESWVQVVNGSGAVVIQRMLKPGDEVDFSTAPPYAVVLGRADAAEVLVRGRPFDVTPFARNSVARFEVK